MQVIRARDLMGLSAWEAPQIKRIADANVRLRSTGGRYRWPVDDRGRAKQAGRPKIVAALNEPRSSAHSKPDGHPHVALDIDTALSVRRMEGDAQAQSNEHTERGMKRRQQQAEAEYRCSRRDELRQEAHIEDTHLGIEQIGEQALHEPDTRA